MDLRAVILACLVTPLPGCMSTFGCDPPQEDFYLDMDLSNTDLVIASAYAGDPETARCSSLCMALYMDERGWTVDEVHTCSHELDLDAFDTAEEAEDQIVGHLTCTGQSKEYECKGRRPLGYQAPTLARASPASYGGAAPACLPTPRLPPRRASASSPDGSLTARRAAPPLSSPRNSCRQTTKSGCGSPDGPSALGRALARFAELEGASVLAFEELALALEGFSAPAALVARCRAAAEDERLHARLMGSLARRHGAQVPTSSTRRVRPTLVAVATHNAVEGCVHESWAAVEARWQAAYAPDRGLRAIAARIARDEAEHGQLAWDLHAWLLPRLSPRSRARVLRAQRAALARLPEVALASAAATPPALGLPGPEPARLLAERFATFLETSAPPPPGSPRGL